MDERLKIAKVILPYFLNKYEGNTGYSSNNKYDDAIEETFMVVDRMIELQNETGKYKWKYR